MSCDVGSDISPRSLPRPTFSARARLAAACFGNAASYLLAAQSNGLWDCNIDCASPGVPASPIPPFTNPMGADMATSWATPMADGADASSTGTAPHADGPPSTGTAPHADGSRASAMIFHPDQ